MLSEWASREREWGPYPALRIILENKPAPSELCPAISTDDNIIEELGRSLKIALLALEHRDQLIQMMAMLGARALLNDLEHLTRLLGDKREFLQQIIVSIERLQDEIFKS